MADEARPDAEGSKEQQQADAERKKPRVTNPRKGGVVSKAVDAITGPLSGIRLPQLDWKLVSWGLLILIAIILVVRNWAPVRINIFGWYLDPPKAIAFAVFFGLGALTVWLVEMRAKRHPRVKLTAPTVELVEAEEAEVEESDEAVEAMSEDDPTDHDAADADGGL